MSTTAKIAARGCKGTAIDDQLAEQLHDHLGRTILAIVEISSSSRTEDTDGNQKVTLKLGDIEVVPDGMAADHIRELFRLFYYERQRETEGPALDYDDGPAPKVADVLAAGERFRPHPYLASTLSTDDSDHGPVCDICGAIETAAAHTITDPFAVPDGAA